MADTLDILTLAEARRAINVDASWVTHQTELEQFITAVSRRIDDIVGPVVVRTVTDEAHDGGRGFIRPYETPVDSVTTVTEYANTSSTTLTAESNASKNASGYLLDDRWTHDVRIIRRSGNADATFPEGRRNVVITYEAGRAANTAAVDEKFKQAAASVLARFWMQYAGSWARGGDPFVDDSAAGGGFRFFDAVDAVVKQLLADETKPVPVM